MIRPAVTRLDPGPYLVPAARRYAGGDGVSLRERGSGQVFRSNRNAL